MSIQSRRWLTAGIVLIAAAVLWRCQAWWLPLLPGPRRQTLDWTATWARGQQ